MVCGTEDGKVLVFEANGELKTEFQYVQTTQNLSKAIRKIVVFSKGLLLACDGGSVSFYEYSDELGATVNAQGTREFYRKIREYNVPDEISNITKVAISSNEDSIVCSTDTSQMFYSVLSNAEVKVSMHL